MIKLLFTDAEKENLHRGGYNTAQLKLLYPFFLDLLILDMN